MKEPKTNVMRILEQKKIKYIAHEYTHGDGPVDGETVAALIGIAPERVFKTLVTSGNGGAHYVFVIPVQRELDLKKAAKAVGEKSIAMIHVSELLPLTGYVRGGCSPVGMKKRFKTVFDSSVLSLDTITVSAGKIGAQIEIAPGELMSLVQGTAEDIT